MTRPMRGGKWQNRLNGVWGKLFKAAVLSIENSNAIEEGGFKITDLIKCMCRHKNCRLPYWGAAEIR